MPVSEEQREPWAYIAHKGGVWGGVTAPNKDAGKFLASFIRKGYSVTTVYSRDEYNAELSKLVALKREPETPPKK